MDRAYRRWVSLCGLGLGMAVGSGCPDDPSSNDDGAGSTGPSLCEIPLVTCPDGSCQPPSPGACCGFGGLCPDPDTGVVDPSNITTPTTTAPPPTITLPDSSSTFPPDTDSTTDTASTGEVVPEGCYDPLIFPYDGPLCGPFGSRCAVQAAETIDAASVARSGTPSLTVDVDCNPAVLFGQTTGGTQGFFAQRLAPDFWDVQSTPFAMIEGGIDYEPITGTFGVVASSDIPDVTAYTYDFGWSVPDFVFGTYSMPSKAFAATGDAMLHGLLHETGVGFVDATWNVGWSLAPATGGAMDVTPALAVAGDDTHHFTYWAYGGLEPELRYETSTGISETITAYGGTGVVSSALPQEVTLTSTPSVTPHVLAGTENGPTGRVEIVYARRDAADTWTVIPVITEDPTGETTCDTPPLLPGETCSLDRTLYRPLAIVSSQGGDVRYFYAETHEQVDYEAVCVGVCSWQPLADFSTYTVYMGWIDAGVPQALAILPDTRLARANAEVDALGAIHLIGYALPNPATLANTLTVEYFQISQ